MNDSRLPVTVLSGFLGSGKTTLLTHLLQNTKGLRIALIVNDISEINIDAALVKQNSYILESEESVVEMSNGCICCTLREDLLFEVQKIAETNMYDYLIIESTGISEPLPVAATFEFEDEEGKSLSDVARLDTMVTIVDASTLLNDYSSEQFIESAESKDDSYEEKALVDLLVEQIEFANVILLNKIDGVDSQDLPVLRSLIRALNPTAHIFETTYSHTSPQNILNTRLFTFEEAHQAPLWYKELNGFKDHVPETEEYGIRTFVFRARRPFHPKKFYNFLQRSWDGVLRSKGQFWIASRPEWAGQMSQAGPLISHEALGLWWAAIPEVDRPQSSQWQTSLKEVWDAEFGDRRQELVFIGINFDQSEIEAALHECLVDETTFHMDTWASLSDPFPHWGLIEEDAA